MLEFDISRWPQGIASVALPASIAKLEKAPLAIQPPLHFPHPSVHLFNLHPVLYCLPSCAVPPVSRDKIRFPKIVKALRTRSSLSSYRHYRNISLQHAHTKYEQPQQPLCLAASASSPVAVIGITHTSRLQIILHLKPETSFCQPTAPARHSTPA